MRVSNLFELLHSVQQSLLVVVMGSLNNADTV